MSLIDRTYFINDINVPDAGNYDNIQQFIDRYEREFLISMFGYTLYKLIAAYNVDTSDQRIKDIVEGKEFEYNDQTYKWQGLVNATTLISPIAYYVFYKRLKDNRTYLSTSNELQTDHESATVTIGTKLLEAWNMLCKLVGTGAANTEYYNSIYFFMWNNYSTYPEWEFDDNLFVPQNSFDL